jgi:hypothetical protein
METFFAILILVPTVAILAVGAVMILGMLVIDTVAGVDGIVVGLRHRLRKPVRTTETRVGNAVLHH